MGHETVLVALVDDLCQGLGEGSMLLFILLDILVKFDTFHHSILLDQLDWLLGALYCSGSSPSCQDVLKGYGDGALFISMGLDCSAVQGYNLPPVLFNVKPLGKTIQNFGVRCH